MLIICPNLKNKEVAAEFNELVEATSEKAAYHIWSQNNGNGIDKAPNGEPSKLFSDLLSHYNGDRKAAIQAKAKVFSESFKTWFGDWLLPYDDMANKYLMLEYFENREGHRMLMDTLYKENPDAAKIYKASFKLITEQNINEPSFGFIDGNVKNHNKLIKLVFGKEAFETEYFADDVYEDVQFDIESKTYEEAMMDLYDLKKKYPELDLKLKSFLHVKSEVKERFEDALEYLRNSDLFQSIYDFVGYLKDYRKKQLSNISKVVDENGEPLIVYHHSDDEISEFSIEFDNYFSKFKNGTKKAIFFTGTSAPASNTILDRPFKIAAFLNIKNAVEKQGTKDQLRESGEDFTATINKSAEKSDGVVFHGIDDNLEENQEIYVIHNPNNVKSIDNRGTFSLLDNNIYHRGLLRDFLFGRNHSAAVESAKTSADLLDYIQTLSGVSDIVKYIALKLKQESIPITIKDTPIDKETAAYNGTLVLFKSRYSNVSNQLFAADVVHEMVHHYLLREYSNNDSLKNSIDAQMDYFKSKIKNWNKWYGFKDGGEFISELLGNDKFRRRLERANVSRWKLLLNKLASYVGLNLFSNEVQKLKQGKKDILNIINVLEILIDSVNSGFIKHYSLKNFKDTKYRAASYADITKNAQNIIKKSIAGLNSRYKALLSKNYPPVLLAALQEEIAKLESLVLQNEDKQVLVEFIKHASTAFKPVLTRIRNAYEDPNKITNLRLQLFQNDFIGFYGPIVNQINIELFLLGYFDDLSPEILRMVKDDMHNITRAYTEIEGKYKSILKTKVKEIISTYGEEYKISTEDIEAYIEDHLNSTSGDLSFCALLIRSTKAVSDLAVRMAYRMMTDINNDVARFADNKAQDILREFERIKKSDVLLYFEKDEYGRTTGNLVRDLNYGRFNRDRKEFMKNLDTKYGVVEGNYYILSEEDFFNYLLEREEWLSLHCERRFKPEYYEAYNALKPITRQRLKAINAEISSLLLGVIDDNGIHLERLTDKEWRQLDGLYSVKRNLANTLYQDGELKDGEDLEIAEDLIKFYEKTGGGNIKAKVMSQAEIRAIIDKKKAELSPEDFAKWQQRNVSYLYSQEFYDQLASLERFNAGAEQDVFDELLEQRRKLLNLGRNNNLPRTDAEKLSQTVKNALKEIDEQIADFYKRYKVPGKQSEFKKIAKMVPTPLYTADKAAAQAAGPEAFAKWEEESHVNGRIVSYYTMLVPKNNKYIEYRLSRMNMDLDKDSELVNENYDFSSPEYYQPKRSLYDNSKAYQEATNTSAKQDIYNLIVNTMSESNSKIPFLSRRDSYKLPLMTGDIVDFTSRGNKFWRGLYDYTIDSMLVRADNSEYSLDNVVQNPDGTLLNFIPTHYIETLDKPQYISRNLPGMLVEYARMAENYKLKNDRLADFELLRQQLADRQVTMSSFGRSEYMVYGKLTNLYKRYQDFLEMNLYGRFRQPTGIKFKFKGKTYQVALSKGAEGLKNYASLSNLSWNLPSIGKALLLGIHKSAVEAFAGRYFRLKDYYRALGQVVLNIPNMLIHLGDRTHNNTLLALMEYNEIARNSKEKMAHYQYNRILAIIMKYLYWGGWSAADYLVKAPILSAVYSDYKYVPAIDRIISRREFIRLFHADNEKLGEKAFNRLNTFSLRDVYTVKNGMPVIKDKYKSYERLINDPVLRDSVKNIIKFLTNRIDGVLSQEDKTKFMTNIFGSAVIMHRSFFINNLEDNFFASTLYNPYIEDYYEAKYPSALKALGKYAYNLGIAIRYFKSKTKRKSGYKNVTSVQNYNLTRTATQIAMMVIYSFIADLMLRPILEDDDENIFLQYMLYLVTGVNFEEQAEYLPKELFNQFKSVSASITPLTNLGNTATLIFNFFDWDKNWDDDDTVYRGVYDDMPKYQRTIIKSIPGLRGLWESQDLKSRQQYLDNLLDE